MCVTFRKGKVISSSDKGKACNPVDTDVVSSCLHISADALKQETSLTQQNVLFAFKTAVKVLSKSHYILYQKLRHCMVCLKTYILKTHDIVQYALQSHCHLYNAFKSICLVCHDE